MLYVTFRAINNYVSCPEDVSEPTQSWHQKGKVLRCIDTELYLSLADNKYLKPINEPWRYLT